MKSGAVIAQICAAAVALSAGGGWVLAPVEEHWPEVVFLPEVMDVPAAAAEGRAAAGPAGAPAAAIGGEAAQPAAAPAPPASTAASAEPPSGHWPDVSSAYAALSDFLSDPSNHWYWNKEGTQQIPVTGLTPLVRDAALEETARLRAKEQWEQFYINKTAAHTRPDGSSCFSVYPPGLSARGENLAWGYPDGASVISGWAETGKTYAGQAHRRNILDPRFTRVGIACYTEGGRTCWAMCLGG